MLLSEVFTEDRIIVDLTSRTKEDLFIELVDFLGGSGAQVDRDQILKGLWDREKMLDTIIAPRISFPHAAFNNFKPPVGILGISKDGIEYGSPGSKPVHIVLLLIDDRNDAKGHMKTLKGVARLIGGPNFFSRIMRCTSAGQIFELILQSEEYERM